MSEQPLVSSNSNRRKELQKFARYEFKYLLNQQLARAIEEDVRLFMSYDGYVHPELGDKYYVRSLYFDNWATENFLEKVDGMKKRNKYRIRTYSKEENIDTPLFLEKKGRTNERTYKVRVNIDSKHLNYFLHPGFHDIILSKYKDNELAEGFVFDCNRKRLKPRVLVDYDRRPYLNNFGLYFRLTFDSHITALKTDTLYPGADSQPFQECRSGYTVLEVKFERSMPPWFHRIIQNYNLRRLSISKFVIGMEQCDMAEDI